jgi:hypothetical protein
VAHLRSPDSRNCSAVKRRTLRSFRLANFIHFLVRAASSGHSGHLRPQPTIARRETRPIISSVQRPISKTQPSGGVKIIQIKFEIFRARRWRR